MSNTKKVTISLTPVSGLIGFLIERWEKEKKKN
jgi:hypothetical protein